MVILKEGRKDIHFFKENKYGCRCAYCGYLFIAEEHEFNTGRWDKKGRWLRGINCPCCTDVIPLEYM